MAASRPAAAAWGAFLITLGAVAALAFFPESRFWSFNQLGYLSSWTIAVFPLAALVMAGLSVWLFHVLDWSISSRSYVIAAGFVFVAAIGAFVIGHTRAHFLGDGYTLLSLLASDTPIIKWRNLGGTIIPYGLLQLLAGNEEPTVLQAYRLVAYVAGGLFVVVAAWGSYRLYEKPVDRLLFLLGLCTGGHMLLFFGYVENYAFFIVIVAAYLLAGMQMLEGRLSRWWLVALQVLAVFFHIFGLVLVPATVYVLFADTAICRRLAALSSRTLWPGIIVLLGLGVGLVFLIQQSISSLAFALMPVRDEWFAIDGYTLFSGAHLLDMLNQLLILWPGLLIAVAVLIWSERPGREKRSPRTVFLGLAALVTLATAFFLDPKIGMARDWDLYAFAGLPLGLLVLDRLSSDRTGRFRPALVLFAVAGVLLLTARVTVLAKPEAAFKQIHSYLYLDPIRNHNVWPVMIKYHQYRGDTARVNALDKERNELLPEERWLMLSVMAMQDGDHQLGLQLAGYARKRYRGMGSFHSTYGSALLNTGRREEAFRELSIALALNEYNVVVLANLGMIHLERGELEEAERYCLRALEIDPQSGPAIFALTTLYSYKGELGPLPDLLERGAKISNMRAELFRKIATAALAGQDYALAARALVLGKDHGISTEVIRATASRYPELKTHLVGQLEALQSDSSAVDSGGL